MDAVTHALLGAQAVQLRGDRLGARERLLLGAAAAAFPDIDFVGFAVDPLRFLAHWHQGPTHSLLLLPAWAALLGALYCTLARRRGAFGDATLIAALGLATHIALDVITAYGTKLLYPLSQRRLGLGITFVVDPLFTALAAAALVAGLRCGRRYAIAGLFLLLAYVALQALLQRRALELASASLPNAERIDAIAQPFSPFNWKLIVDYGEHYQVAHVNVAGHAAPLPRRLGLEPWSTLAHAYLPPRSVEWRQRHRFGAEPNSVQLARELWARPEFEPFRLFAVHPALSRVDEGEDRRCVWFTDLRYDLPALPDTFRYGFCQQPPGAAWKLHRLRYLTRDARQRLE